MGQSSLERLTQRIHYGDKRAETLFCNTYYGSVRRLVTSLCKDPIQAEDVTQDTLLIVLLKLRNEGIDHPDRLTSYVHQTARFTLIGGLRQGSQVSHYESMDDQEGSERTEQVVDGDERRTLVCRMIDSLEVERDREVLIRSYICDEPKGSVCEALALSRTHFDRVISRARIRLRHVVETQTADVRDTLMTG